ncbi:alpha-mannosidase [Paenibacillus glycinis]|uniref:Alpha-mannosidase n=1 Tax=Paenibacillus glycinis TaxID=2697035 RepID=A0ABW9XS22_9BACL|nr:glycoside hydrolase family 38 C-terminal domain-containing protein [Paenibacillus glycinis]NBD25462.1 alpha-mannosidase [Paenibacillus glycinis]
MLFTESKLAARLRELSETRYRDVRPLDRFTAIEDEAGANGARPPASGAAYELNVGDTWQGRDRYVWLSRGVDVPAEWAGRSVLGRFDFGETGGGNNDGFESLFYWNGVPYQGVDSNHQEVFLPEDAAGAAGRMDIRLWTGLEGGGKPRDMKHTVKRAELCWLDERVDDLYYTGQAVLGTIKELDPSHPDRAALVKALDRAFLLIDWSLPGSDAYYESVHAARELLNGELGKFDKRSPVTVTCVGHTHIDVAWLWRLKHTREKSARSFSTVLRLMERFPDYVFLQTQPQLYAYIKQDYPDIYEQIRERIREGRWEIGGGMWLEADCNLTSGESLVRQFLFGTRFMREEFGAESTYLWLPDVFGYSWALPQILRKSGFDTFMTTKISWNQFNRMPNDTFKWRGIDGSEVLTHFITTPDDWEEANAFFYTYNGFVTPETVKGIWDGYRDKEVNQELLLSYGYGDGGGGVNREMLEMRRRLDGMPGLPNVKTGRADDYFRRLQDTFASTDRYVHTWDGELYLEYHRGTYTSQAYNKRMNRKLELLYRETEWLSALAAVQRGDWSLYGQRALNEGWTIILRNQFHDIIPGSSIAEVYADSREEYAQAQAIADEAWQEAAAAIRSGRAEAGAMTVMNGSSWTRRELVVLDAASAPAGSAWSDASGNPLQAQLTDGRWIVESPAVPSLGVAAIHYADDQAWTSAFAAETPFALEGSVLKTPHYELAWNAAGQLIRIYDLDHGRDVLAEGARGNVLQAFEDKPMHFDAWDIDIFYQEKLREITELESAELVELGPLAATVAFRWRYAGSVVTQKMTVYAGSRRIDFRTHIDWREHQQLLKVAFPVAVRATEATYDIQFGNVKRPTHWNTSWDYARFESVGHQWADLSERGYGVSLLNDCKYGYDIKDNVMRLSLIKSAIHPDPNADIGEHEFTYALLPHAGDWYAGNTAQEAWALNNPLTSVAGAPAGGTLSMFALSAPNVMVDAVKKSEDGERIVLRVHEFAGMRANAELRSDLRIRSVRECDLMERPLADGATGENLGNRADGEDRANGATRESRGSQAIGGVEENPPIRGRVAKHAIELKPYEIKTFLIELESGSTSSVNGGGNA